MYVGLKDNVPDKIDISYIYYFIIVSLVDEMYQSSIL